MVSSVKFCAAAFACVFPCLCPCQSLRVCTINDYCLTSFNPVIAVADVSSLATSCGGLVLWLFGVCGQQIRLGGGYGSGASIPAMGSAHCAYYRSASPDVPLRRRDALDLPTQQNLRA